MLAFDALQWLRELRAWYPPFRVVILHDSAHSQLGARPSRKCVAFRNFKF